MKIGEPFRKIENPLDAVITIHDYNFLRVNTMYFSSVKLEQQLLDNLFDSIFRIFHKMDIYENW